MATYIVEGLEITYVLDPTGSLGEWGAYRVQHLKGDETTRVRFSRRKYGPTSMGKALRSWLDAMWIRTRNLQNSVAHAPFFSDKSLSGETELSADGPPPVIPGLGESRPKTRMPPVPKPEPEPKPGESRPKTRMPPRP